MTEEQAREKWCPMARQYAFAGNHGVAVNRAIDSDDCANVNCIASDCMMWVWNNDYESMTEEGQGGDIVLRLKRKTGEPKLGHCGLAK